MKTQKKKKAAGTVAAVLAGNLILAFTVTAFIVPQGIIMGGATGVGLTIAHYLPLSLSSVVLVVNIALFVLGALALGKKFALTTLVSTFAYPVILSAVQKIPSLGSLTENRMLASVYAGVLLGIGVGIIVRVGASTGGTDILALALHRGLHIPVAVLLYGVDFVVLGCQLPFSDMEQVLYGIFTLMAEMLVLNQVMVMGRSQMQLFVISESYEEIRQKMLQKMDAGVTMVNIETGYEKEKSKGILCIVPDRKLFSVKEMVHEVDPKAFITISKIHEVRGRGFTMDRLYKEETFL